MESVEFIYTLTPREVARFNVYTFKHAKPLRPIYWVMTAALGIECILLGLNIHDYGLHRGLLSLGPFPYVILLLYIYTYSPMTKSLFFQLQRLNNRVFQPMTLRFHEAGFHSNTMRGEWDVAWGDIDSIIEAPSGDLYIYLNPKLGYLLPVRAFDSPLAAHNFAIELIATWKQHRSPPP